MTEMFVSFALSCVAEFGEQETEVVFLRGSSGVRNAGHDVEFFFGYNFSLLLIRSGHVFFDGVALNSGGYRN
jgi:hypothetical protein